MRYLVFATLILCAAPALGQRLPGAGDRFPDTVATLGGAATADIDGGGTYDLVNFPYICQEAPTTDVAPRDTIIGSAACYALGTQTASDTIIHGGDDEMSITVDTTGGNEVLVTVTQICMGAALSALTEGTHFDCSGLSDAVCAANLAVAIAAQSGTCVTATSVGSVVSPQPIDCSAYATSFASAAGGGGGVAFTVDNGTDGVILAMSDIAANLVSFDIDRDTYFTSLGIDDRLYLYAGGVLRFHYQSNQIFFHATANINDFNITNPDDIYHTAAMASDTKPTPVTVWNSKHPFPGIGASNNDGAPICIIPASGANDLTGVTAGNTAGLTFSFTALDFDCEETITVITEGIDFACVAETDADCVVNIAATVNGLSAALGLNAAVVIGETTNFFPTVGTIAHLTVVSSDNAEMVIVRGTDGVFKVKGAMEVAGAATFGASVTATGGVISSGNVRAGSTSRFYWAAKSEMYSSADGDILFTDDAVTGFDSLQLAPAMATDADPADPAILGPNSWPRATGDNRIGGSIHIGGGIGTRQIICTDRTVADTDEVRFEINDQVTTLVESTDFDCEGEASEEVCCDNLGSAITTAAIGITPDCDTTAGTCYLTPDADLHGLDIFLVDGAANGIFATKVQGSQGPFQAMGSSVTLADQMFDLTDNTAGTFVKIEVDSNTHFGAQLFYSIHADDGTDYQLRSGMITVAAVNKAGTITCSIGTPPGNFEAIAVSASTLTLTLACADAGGGVLNITADADSGLTVTTLEIHYSVLLNDPAVVIPQ